MFLFPNTLRKMQKTWIIMALNHPPMFLNTPGGNDYKLSSKLYTDGKAYYATMNDENLIFTVSANLFTFLDKPIEEIISSFCAPSEY